MQEDKVEIEEKKEVVVDICLVEGMKVEEMEVACKEKEIAAEKEKVLPHFYEFHKDNIDVEFLVEKMKKYVEASNCKFGTSVGPWKGIMMLKKIIHVSAREKIEEENNKIVADNHKAENVATSMKKDIT